MLILVAHGSRDPLWRESLDQLTQEVRTRLQSDEVAVAFMQFDGPKLPEVVAAAARAGRKHLRLLPLFMASAGHVEKDIKPLVAELARAHPGMELELMTPVGEDDLFPGFIVDMTKAHSGPI